MIADSEDDDDDDNEQTIATSSAASAAVKVIQRRLALTTAVKTPCSEDWRVNMRRLHLDLIYCYKIVFGLTKLNFVDFFF